MKISRKLMQEVLHLPGYTSWITGASWDPNTLSVVVEVTGDEIPDDTTGVFFEPDPQGARAIK